MHSIKQSAQMLTMVAILLISATAAPAGVVVIGHKDSAGVSLNAKQTKGLFLGKSKKLPDGKAVEMVNLPEGSPVRDEFYVQVAHKSDKQLRAYWAKRIFAGKGSPAPDMADEKAVVDWVSAAPGRVGYVSNDAVTADVAVLFSTP